MVVALHAGQKLPTIDVKRRMPETERITTGF
jgi:hypothetical protein